MTHDICGALYTVFLKINYTFLNSLISIIFEHFINNIKYLKVFNKLFNKVFPLDEIKNKLYPQVGALDTRF